MSNIPNFEQAKNYFEERLTTHGATARGVDWNSETAQELRFSQLDQSYSTRAAILTAGLRLRLRRTGRIPAASRAYRWKSTWGLMCWKAWW